MDNKKLFLIVLILLIVSLSFALTIKKSPDSFETEPLKTTTTIRVTESTEESDPEIEYTFYDVPLDIETQKEVISICSEYGLEYELILGIITVECESFNPKSTGDGGASLGLMQIQPKWWSDTMEREGVTDLLDPLQNIRCGCAILNELKNTYGTEYRALQAYNTGRPDTKNGYAEKVYRRVDELTRLTG